MRFFSFTLLISGGALLGHVYLYLRMRPLLRTRGGRLGILAVLGFFSVTLAVRNPLSGRLDEALREVLSRANFAWLGLMLCLVLAFATLDLFRMVAWLMRMGAWLMRKLRPASRADKALAAGADGAAREAHGLVQDLARRELLVRVAGSGAALAGGALAGYGSWRAFTAPEITELAVRIPRLPRALDGLTIVQISDVHVGPYVRRKFMDALVERTSALKPDLVVITGDLVDGSVPHLGHAVAALGNLRSRFGTYFVTGNHEYYSGEVAWVRFLERQGIPTLRNRTVQVGDAGGRIDLVGVDDWSGGRRRGRQGYDLERALEGRNPERAAVLLAHQPANFEVAAARGIDLQLSGHTHGGQLFPMTMLVGLQWEHVAGHYRHRNSHLYVSRGCGFWGPPMRIGSPPELVKLVLTT